MSKIQIQKLDLNKKNEIKNRVNYKNIKNVNKGNFRSTNNNFKKSKSIIENYSKKENEKNRNEEISKIFNKTYNNKPFIFSRNTTKEVSFKLKNKIDEIKKQDDNENDKESKNEFKKLIRNISSISKETTMYKTKKKFYSSSQLDKNNLYTNISFKENKKNHKNKRSVSEKKIIRSYSANNIMDYNKNNNNIFGGSQFITALNPLFNQRNLVRKTTEKSSKSFFFNKIKAEKKFLTYFDIKKIYFLDKKVYKPNKEFENEINKLKRNNSTEFIMNFNLDSYKMTILNLFQKHICHQNYDIMKKNFELINNAWKWKDNLKCHKRKKKVVPLSQTEREIIYNQNKIDRENRIKSRNPNNNQENKE